MQTVKEAAPELTASSSEAEEEKEEHVKVDGEGDPDFGQVHTAGIITPLFNVYHCCQTIFLIRIQMGVLMKVLFCSN